MYRRKAALKIPQKQVFLNNVTRCVYLTIFHNPNIPIPAFLKL